MTTERQHGSKTHRRPLSPEELELLGEGAEEQADEALEMAELAATATFEVVQSLND